MSNTHPPDDEDLSLLDLPLNDERIAEGDFDEADDFDDTDPGEEVLPDAADADGYDDFDDEADFSDDPTEEVDGSGLFGGNLDLSELADGEDEEFARAVREARDDLGADRPTPLQDRALAGLADLLVQLTAVGTALIGTILMEVEISFDLWLPFAVLAMVFSFLYWFIPLAFWGHTPGMGWAGHRAISLDDQPLSFAQTALRWVGGVFTLGLLGLPLLLALTGRSFTDRLSDSKTVSPID